MWSPEASVLIIPSTLSVVYILPFGHLDLLVMVMVVVMEFGHCNDEEDGDVGNEQ